ncbi:hypothetical protein [Blastococcus sp. SYSU D00820]
MPRPLLALAAAGLLFLAACGGDAGEPPAPAAGPQLTEVAGAADLEAAVGSGDVLVLGVVPAPDGSWLVHVTGDRAGDPGWLVPVEPGDGGPVAGDAVELPPLDATPELHVAPDGSAVLLEKLPDDTLAVLTLAPGEDEPAAQPVTPPLDRSQATLTSALSPDGATLYLVAGAPGGSGPVRLLSIDVATGEVGADVALDLAADGELFVPARLAAGPDGPVLAGTVHGEDTQRLVLARFDTGLRPDGDPVVLAEDAAAAASALAVTPDGTAVVAGGSGETSDDAVALFVVTGDEATALPLDDAEAPPLGLAPTADGSAVHVPVRLAAGGTVLLTADLADGTVGTTTPLCADDSALVGRAALAGNALLVAGSCPDLAGGALAAVLVR